jgi:hypothetical protein
MNDVHAARVKTLVASFTQLRAVRLHFATPLTTESRSGLSVTTAMRVQSCVSSGACQLLLRVFDAEAELHRHRTALRGPVWIHIRRNELTCKSVASRTSARPASRVRSCKNSSKCAITISRAMRENNE